MDETMLYHGSKEIVAFPMIQTAKYNKDSMINDSALMYTCSLIEYIGREKKHSRGDVVKLLGQKMSPAFTNMQTYCIVNLSPGLQMNILPWQILAPALTTMWENVTMKFRTIGISEKYMSNSLKM